MKTPDLGHDLEQALGGLLLRRNRASLYSEMLQRAGSDLDEALYPVLSGLDRVGATSAARLGEQIGLDRSVVSRHADRLQALGLICRNHDPQDARVTELSLSAQGAQLVARLRDALAASLQNRLDSWETSEAEAFVSGLQRFVNESPD